MCTHGAHVEVKGQFCEVGFLLRRLHGFPGLSSVIRVVLQAPSQADPFRPPCPAPSPFPLTRPWLSTGSPEPKSTRHTELPGESYPLHPDAPTLQGVPNKRWLLGQSGTITVTSIQLQERNQTRRGNRALWTVQREQEGDHLLELEPVIELPIPGYDLSFPTFERGRSLNPH